MSSKAKRPRRDRNETEYHRLSEVECSLSERQKAELTFRLGISEETIFEIEMAIWSYVVRRSEEKASLSTSEIVSRFDEIEQTIVKLVDLLLYSHRDVGFLLWKAYEDEAGNGVQWGKSGNRYLRFIHEAAEAETLQTTLRYLRLKVLEARRQALLAGTGGAPRKRAQRELAFRLAMELEKAGLSLDLRPKGPLAITLRIALEAVGEKRADVLNILRSISRHLASNAPYPSYMDL